MSFEPATGIYHIKQLDKAMSEKDIPAVHSAVNALISPNLYDRLWGGSPEARSAISPALLLAGEVLAKSGDFASASKAAEAVAVTADPSSDVGRKAVTALGNYFGNEHPPSEATPAAFNTALSRVVDQVGQSQSLKLALLATRYVTRGSEVESRLGVAILPLVDRTQDTDLAKQGIAWALARRAHIAEMHGPLIDTALNFIGRTNNTRYHAAAREIANQLKQTFDPSHERLRALQGFEIKPTARMVEGTERLAAAVQEVVSRHGGGGGASVQSEYMRHPARPGATASVSATPGASVPAGRS